MGPWPVAFGLSMSNMHANVRVAENAREIRFSFARRPHVRTSAVASRGVGPCVGVESRHEQIVHRVVAGGRRTHSGGAASLAGLLIESLDRDSDPDVDAE